jgi:hypothetical protein
LISDFTISNTSIVEVSNQSVFDVNHIKTFYKNLYLFKKGKNLSNFVVKFLKCRNSLYGLFIVSFKSLGVGG